MSIGQAHSGRRHAVAALALGLFAVAATAACRQGNAQARTGGPAAAHLDGQERVEWDQAGKSLEQVNAFRYMAVIGQIPRDITDVRCTAKAPDGPFVCSGKLPEQIPKGVHQLRLIAVAKDGPKNLISRWSAPILVEKR